MYETNRARNCNLVCILICSPISSKTRATTNDSELSLQLCKHYRATLLHSGAHSLWLSIVFGSLTTIAARKLRTDYVQDKTGK